LQSRIAALETLIRRIRHDVRSALAPAMLAADMMRMHAEPKVQGSGAVVARSVERVLGTLDSTHKLVPPQSGPTSIPARARSGQGNACLSDPRAAGIARE
jgi:hypothetical protein